MTLYNIDKERLCLKCNKPFISKGSWNRLCSDCNYENSNETISRYAKDPSIEKESEEKDSP